MTIMPKSNGFKARESLSTALRITPRSAESDLRNFDALPEKAWLDKAGVDFRFLICASEAQLIKIHPYGRALTKKLKAQLDCLELDKESDSLRKILEEGIEHEYDLVILAIQQQPLWNSLFTRSLNDKLMNKLRTSLLFVPEPRWPLTKTLLILQDEEEDDQAVEWAIRFAKTSNANITVLTIVPAAPAMYRGLRRFEAGLPEILKSNSALGRRLHRVAEQLARVNIEATFRLRQGSPEWQSQCEIAEGDYDLIISGADPSGWLPHYLLGGLNYHLVNHSGRPVLVVKSKTE